MIFSPSFLTGLALLQSEHHLPLPTKHTATLFLIPAQRFPNTSPMPQPPLQNYSHVSAKPHSVQLI